MLTLILFVVLFVVTFALLRVIGQRSTVVNVTAPITRERHYKPYGGKRETDRRLQQIDRGILLAGHIPCLGRRDDRLLNAYHYRIVRGR